MQVLIRKQAEREVLTREKKEPSLMGWVHLVGFREG